MNQSFSFRKFSIKYKSFRLDVEPIITGLHLVPGHKEEEIRPAALHEKVRSIPLRPHEHQRRSSQEVMHFVNNPG